MHSKSKKYPVITQGYGVFIEPNGGYIFPYEEINGVKRAHSSCENLNVQACAILAHCTGSETVEDIVHALEDIFEDIPPDLFAQVESFLEEAVEKEYIYCSDEPVQMQGIIQGSITYYTPTQVLIETTAKCNLDCKHCLLSAGEPLPDELTVSEFIPLIERLYEIGVKRVHLSGGEVLTKEGWEKMADFCIERFYSGILTNGILITEEIADKLTSYKEVHISLYGRDAETHEKITGVPGSFERAVKGITLLTERDMYVGASVLMVPFNLHQLEDMVKLAISLKCKIMRVGIISPVGRAYTGEWELTEEQKALLDTKMSELKEKYKDEITVQWEEEPRKEHRCGAGYTRWVVISNGDVYPCAIFRVPIGNLKRDDPVDILNLPAVQFLQELKAPHDALCGDCHYLYACGECHGQAFAHYFKVDHCGWAQQFEKAPEPFKSAIWNKMNRK